MFRSPRRHYLCWMRSTPVKPTNTETRALEEILPLARNEKRCGSDARQNLSRCEVAAEYLIRLDDLDE